MRPVLVLALSAVCCAALLRCGPPCDNHPWPVTAGSACVMADAGSVAVDAGFSLKVSTNGYSATGCVVNVDPSSGRITFDLGTAVISCLNSGDAAPREPPMAICRIPALAPGQYTLNTEPQIAFSLPPGDAGLTICP